MKKHIPFLLFLFFCSATAQDLVIIKKRLTTTYLTNPTKVNVDAILVLMNDQGGFTDLNYTGETDLRLHINRINSLASAYSNSNNYSTYYNSTAIKTKYYLGLKFWIDTNQTPPNWWYRQIAYPKEVTKGFVLLADSLKTDNLSLYNNTVAYLIWGYNQNKYMDGANISDTIIGAFGAAVYESNTLVLNQFKNWIDGLLLIDDTGEGIGADYMFAQHSTFGRQINTMSYGKELYKSVLSYIESTNGTIYEVNNINNLENGILNAFQWITFKNTYDPSTSGRDLNTNTFIGDLVSISDRMVALNSPQKTALITANNRIKGANTLIGNVMYWRLDYMIHRNLNYIISTRMTSTRTVSTESDKVSIGLHNYYSGAGVNYITVTGTEYNSPFFKNFNYRQFPGTTAEQDNQVLPIIAWGEGGTNGSSLAGGVSNGIIGCSGMIWDKRNLKAYKSWFYFPDEIIALGSGINESIGTANVFTTLNQTNFDTNEGVSYNKSGSIITTKNSSNFNIQTPNWFFHGKIGYLNINANSETFVINTDNNIVSIAIDHGVNPVNQQYSYAILPNTSLIQMPDLVTALTEKIVIESNTARIQSVTHKTLDITQIVFFENTGGTLVMSTGEEITVNTACMLILDRKAAKIYVSNPRAETGGATVLLNYIKEGVTISKTITFPTGNLSGSTTSFCIDNLAIKSISMDQNIKAIVRIEINKINIKANFPIETVDIYNITGAKIDSFKVNGLYEITENNILLKGVYIVVINNNFKMKTISNN